MVPLKKTYRYYYFHVFKLENSGIKMGNWSKSITLIPYVYILMIIRKNTQLWIRTKIIWIRLHKMEIYYKIRGDKILNNRNQIKVVGMHRVSGYESCIPDRYPAGHPVGPDTGFQSRNPTILKLEFTCNKIF